MKRWNKRTWRIIGTAIVAVALVVGLAVYFTVILPKQQAHNEHKQAMEEYRAAKRAKYAQENAQWDDYEVDVAFLGDSLTDGYDLNKYYPQYVTANRGIGGDTTFDLEERLQLSVYDLKPKVAVMLIGVNNVDNMMENYEDILRGLKTNLPETKIVLLSLTAMGGEYWGSKNQVVAYRNVSIKLLAEKYGFTFVDLYSPLYDVDIGEVYEGYTIDGGHFTHQGYTVLTATITPVLQELLGK